MTTEPVHAFGVPWVRGYVGAISLAALIVSGYWALAHIAWAALG